MQLREYQPSDCAQMAELFYQTVHSVNAKNYTKEQLDAWAIGFTGVGQVFSGSQDDLREQLTD